MKKMRKFLALVLLALLSFTIVGCNEATLEITGDNVGSFSSYDQLKEYLAANMESNKSTRLYNEVAMAGDFASEDSLEASVPQATNDEPDYSETNNQVEGVSEADKILTDGYKIYIVSGSKFFIVDADTLAIDYTLELENGYMSEMYLYDGKAVLISHEYTYTESICSYSDYYYEDKINEDGSEPSDETTVTETVSTELRTYVCYKYSYGTKITVLDVADTTDVTVARELYFDSSYIIDSRMIDEQLYLILNNYMYNYGYDEDVFVPQYIDSVVSDELTLLPANRIFFMPNDGNSFSFLTLVSFDVTDNDEANIKAYLGSSWQIYMSLSNMYTIVQKWEYLEEDGIYDYHTYVLRFEISNGELVYKAMGEIEGYPLNQFSMDEYDGVFRIATTGWSYSAAGEWKVDNFVFLLDATTEDTMEELSVLKGIGKPNERIYSARFSEETAYVVTFQQIDPLYKLDLSDPLNPVIVGELEEEGVSDYLHEITDNLMIGIGRQAEDMDGWTRFTGVKVALYNTTGDVVENIETYLVEGEYSYTNVIWDHKAFLSFTPNGADFTYVGVPVFEYFEDYYGYSQSMYLFKVYHSGDLELVTKLTHMVEDTEQGYYRYFDSIERAVIIDNHVYTVSYSSIMMFDMDDDFNKVGETELNPSYYEYWGYPITPVGGTEMID
ncbi:MAG: beta-propeller domain-containing protein [Tenericutes bacterium]|nr:beta-propeller domain-containing protein [Mycoplasmatota bacterium]